MIALTIACLKRPILGSLYQSYINFLRLNSPNLKDITLPVEVPLQTLKSKLNEKILSGEYNIEANLSFHKRFRRPV